MRSDEPTTNRAGQGGNGLEETIELKQSKWTRRGLDCDVALNKLKKISENRGCIDA